MENHQERGESSRTDGNRIHCPEVGLESNSMASCSSNPATKDMTNPPVIVDECSRCSSITSPVATSSDSLKRTASCARHCVSIHRVDVDAPPPDPNDPYQTSAASARIVSQFCRPGASPLAHDTLVFPELYSEVTLRGIKLFAHVNQLVLDYEAESRLDKRRVEDAREITLTAQGKLDKASKKLEIAAREISQLKADKAKLEKTQKEAGDRIKVLENGNKRRDEMIRQVTAELEAVTELTETKILNAVEETKREFTNRFQTKLSRARSCFERMKGKALEDMIDLYEMKSELQLITLLQSDKAPTLDAEEKNVAKHIKDLRGADEQFLRIVSEMDKALTFEPVDGLAASIGVAESSCSN